MLAMEQILSELNGEELNEQGLPPGFRFHPTDEELITFYLASKVFKGTFCGVEIAEVDLNRCEPWELPGTHLYHSPHVSHLMQHNIYIYIYIYIWKLKVQKLITSNICPLFFSF